MVCENCFGLISISITCFLISLILLRKYLNEKNQFTLYMVFFFLLAGLGWFTWLLTTEMVFDVYNEAKSVLMIIGLVPQLVLLTFLLTFFEVSVFIRILIIIAAVFFSILHIFLPSYHISTIVSVIIIISNIILFGINWRKNNDLK
ncbi:MAG: hypothetical protein EU548_05460, partial [Promethearchaeota archaeon]